MNDFTVGKYLKILKKFDEEMKSMTIQDITIPYVVETSTKIGQLVVEIFDSCIAAILSYLYDIVISFFLNLIELQLIMTIWLIKI